MKKSKAANVFGEFFNLHSSPIAVSAHYKMIGATYYFKPWAHGISHDSSNKNNRFASGRWGHFWEELAWT